MLSASFFNANAIESFGSLIAYESSNGPIGAPYVINVSIALALHKLELSPQNCKMLLFLPHIL